MKSDFDTAHPFMLEAGLGDIEARDLWVDAEPLCDAAQLQSARTLISAASASAAGNPKRGRPAVIQQVIPQIVHVDPRHAVSFSHATFQTLRREYASYGRTRCRALAMAAAASMPTTLTLPLKAESDDNHQIPRKAKRTHELGRLWRISMQSWSI